MKFITLDLDDTLYLERYYVKSGFKQVSQFLESTKGVVGFYESAWKAFEDGLRGTIFNHVLAQLGCSADLQLVDELVKVYRTHSPDIELCPDSVTFLDQHDPSYCGLITDGPSESQRAKVQSLGLGEKIGEICLTSELVPPTSKPDIVPFQIMMDRAPRGVAEFIYVADNPKKDFVAPNLLGWRSIQIRRDGALYIDNPSPLDGTPQYSVVSFDEVNRILG